MCKPFIAGYCHYGSRCYNAHPEGEELEGMRRKYSTTACRYGIDCRNQSCLFWHPEVAYPDDYADSLSDAMGRSHLDGDPWGGCEPCWAPQDGAAFQQPDWQQPHSNWQQPGVMRSEWEEADGDEPPDALLAALQPRGVENLPLYPMGPEDDAEPAAAEAHLWAQNDPLRSAVPPAPLAPLRALPANWHAATDPSSGREYYYNATTNATSWERPAAPAEGSLPLQSLPAPGTWAAVATASASAPAPPAGRVGTSADSWGGAAAKVVRIPVALWLPDVSRTAADTAFRIAEPLARFEEVNRPYAVRMASSGPLPLSLPASGASGGAAAGAAIVDLHYQSVRTVRTVLDRVLPARLERHPEVWLVTGTGHHVAHGSHQRTEEGGVLRGAVEAYLLDAGHTYYVGKDHAGQSGAFLVVAR